TCVPKDLLVKWPPLQFDVLKRWLPLIISVAVLLIAALALQIDWSWKRKLSPRGGRYFFHRVELAVPSFRQSDEKWSNDPLGGIEANGTLGGHSAVKGALVASDQNQVFPSFRSRKSYLIPDREAQKSPSF